MKKVIQDQLILQLKMVIFCGLFQLVVKLINIKKIVETKNRKYGNCKSIIIDKIINQEMAILIQNAFPTLEKYIDHVHMENGVPVKVAITLQEKILLNFENLIKKKRHGVNLFFTDIDKIKEKMLEEIDKI